MDTLQNLLGTLSPKTAQTVDTISDIAANAKTWAVVALVLLGLNAVGIAYLIATRRKA